MAYTFLIRFLALFYLLAVFGLGFLFFLFFSQNYREMESLREQEAAMERVIELREKELDRKRQYADRLANDPEFLERVIRQQLGFTREQEYLFRFEEESGLFGRNR